MIKDRSKQLLFLFCLPPDEIYDHLIRGMRVVPYYGPGSEHEGTNIPDEIWDYLPREMHVVTYYGPDSEHEGTNMPEVIFLELSEHFLSDEISLGCKSDALRELCWLISTMWEIALRAPKSVRLRFLESHDYFWAVVKRYARLVLVELNIPLECPSFDFREVLEAHLYSVKIHALTRK